MIELDQSQFCKVISLFKNIRHNVPLVYAAIEQTHPSRIFADNIKKPEAALIVLGDILFISGDVGNDICRNTIYNLLCHDILPDVQERYFDFYTFSNEWNNLLQHLFKNKICVKANRIVFSFDKERFIDLLARRAEIPEGFSIKQIDRNFIEEFGYDKEFWKPATKRFGFCLLKDGEVVSECISVFVGGGQAEVSISTKEQYRGQGFARLTATAFIEHCLRQGLEPNWACWDDREASAALAKKLGFEEKDRVVVPVIDKEM